MQKRKWGVGTRGKNPVKLLHLRAFFPYAYSRPCLAKGIRFYLLQWSIDKATITPATTTIWRVSTPWGFHQLTTLTDQWSRLFGLHAFSSPLKMPLTPPSHSPHFHFPSSSLAECKRKLERV